MNFEAFGALVVVVVIGVVLYFLGRRHKEDEIVEERRGGMAHVARVEKEITADSANLSTDDKREWLRKSNTHERYSDVEYVRAQPIHKPADKGGSSQD
jgi:hypothetical protein